MTQSSMQNLKGYNLRLILIQKTSATSMLKKTKPTSYTSYYYYSPILMVLL